MNTTNSIPLTGEKMNEYVQQLTQFITNIQDTRKGITTFKPHAKNMQAIADAAQRIFKQEDMVNMAGISTFTQLIKTMNDKPSFGYDKGEYAKMCGEITNYALTLHGDLSKAEKKEAPPSNALYDTDSVKRFKQDVFREVFSITSRNHEQIEDYMEIVRYVRQDTGKYMSAGVVNAAVEKRMTDIDGPNLGEGMKKAIRRKLDMIVEPAIAAYEEIVGNCGRSFTFDTVKNNIQTLSSTDINQPMRHLLTKGWETSFNKLLEEQNELKGYLDQDTLTDKHRSEFIRRMNAYFRPESYQESAKTHQFRFNTTAARAGIDEYNMYSVRRIFANELSEDFGRSINNKEIQKLKEKLTKMIGEDYFGQKIEKIPVLIDKVVEDTQNIFKLTLKEIKDEISSAEPTKTGVTYMDVAVKPIKGGNTSWIEAIENKGEPKQRGE